MPKRANNEKKSAPVLIFALETRVPVLGSIGNLLV
jgi:hypothetical protein